METKFYCSECGFSLKVTEVKDFSIPNFTELRIMIRPCTECAAQQSAQPTLLESARTQERCDCVACKQELLNSTQSG